MVIVLKADKITVLQNIGLRRNRTVIKEQKMWSVVNFGKWRGKGKTLPQIVVSDPDWFFWAVENDVFEGALRSQADKLERRARAIKLPAGLADTHCIQYMFTPEWEFAHFNIIPNDQAPHVGFSWELRSPTLDVAGPRDLRSYNKLGGKYLLKDFRYYWFSNHRWTKARVEAFFDDTRNFVNP